MQKNAARAVRGVGGRGVRSVDLGFETLSDTRTPHSIREMGVQAGARGGRRWRRTGPTAPAAAGQPNPARSTHDGRPRLNCQNPDAPTRSARPGAHRLSHPALVSRSPTRPPCRPASSPSAAGCSMSRLPTPDGVVTLVDAYDSSGPGGACTASGDPAGSPCSPLRPPWPMS